MTGVLCAGAFAAGPASALADCPGADLQAGDQGTAALEQSVLCLINERRAHAAVAPVRPNPQLAQAASQHANDMVSRGFFSHNAPGGRSFVDRITASGYMRGARSWLVGENLAWGSGEPSTPASLVKAWMESPPHRANLLRERFREVGVSAARGTPFDAADGDGITLSSEYGQRVTKKRSGAKSRKARRAAARRARARSG